MTNNEINKILSMLEKNDLEELKHFLLREMYINNNTNRQLAFENYLINKNNITRVCVDNGVQKFTNGSSFYILTSNILDLNTFKLEKNKNKYKVVSNELFDKYITQISYLTKFDISFEPIEDLYTKGDNKFVFIKTKNSNNIKSFDSEEIKTASILLNEPNYSISNCSSIIKAESDIGKAYILSIQNK